MPQGRWEESINEKICALDIDGVLNYYPQPWLDFLNDWLDEDFKDLNNAKESIPYQQYREIKWEYRESGIKSRLAVREGAVDLTHRLKDKGYTIIVLTARPFHNHKSLFKQTIDWLHHNHLKYDGLIFGENKQIEVLSKAPNLEFFIEDHRAYANQLARWGYKVFLVNNRYNTGSLLPSVIRINELKEVFNHGV